MIDINILILFRVNDNLSYSGFTVALSCEKVQYFS